MTRFLLRDGSGHHHFGYLTCEFARIVLGEFRSENWLSSLLSVARELLMFMISSALSAMKTSECLLRSGDDNHGLLKLQTIQRVSEVAYFAHVKFGSLSMFIHLRQHTYLQHAGSQRLFKVKVSAMTDLIPIQNNP